MIRKNVKDKRKNKTIKQVIYEYIVTVLFSIIIALVLTCIMAIHARSEMIKNLHISSNQISNLDFEYANSVINKSDLTKDLDSKSYKYCVYVGNLYYTAKVYDKAQYAYQKAIEKTKVINYSLYLKFVEVMIQQENFDDAINFIDSIQDKNNKKLIKFKTRAYIDMGDKYYSVGKFISAAKSYEKAKFYYDKFAKKDSAIESSILDRIVNSYEKGADVIVKSGYTSDAIRLLLKAQSYSPDNYNIIYKLAIVYSSIDPIKSIYYFDKIIKKNPQGIDNKLYTTTLMKAANIKDLEGEPTKAKYYRYKIHSIDLFLDNKVVYKDDYSVNIENLSVKKTFFKYRIKFKYNIVNYSYKDIFNLYVDFVLQKNGKPVETITIKCVDKSKPLLSNGGFTNFHDLKFLKKIYTKKELGEYSIGIFLYKDEKFKTMLDKVFLNNVL